MRCVHKGLCEAVSLRPLIVKLTMPWGEKFELVVLILRLFVLAKILKVCWNTAAERADNFFDHTGRTRPTE